MNPTSSRATDTLILLWCIKRCWSFLKRALRRFWAFHEISLIQRGWFSWRFDRAALTLGSVRLEYSDAAQLCIRLYTTVAGVPNELLPLIKERLGDDFAQLAQSGWIASDDLGLSSAYGASFHHVTDRGHWIEVNTSIIKIGPKIVDHERGATIARAAGFDTVDESLHLTRIQEGEEGMAGQPAFSS